MRFFPLAVSGILAALVIFGCSKDESTTGNQTVGTLKVHLTDAPGVFEKVNITFSQISVNLKSSEDSWIVISDQEQTFDLMKLTNGITTLLGEKQLDPGQYGQIRLKIINAEVVVDGTTYALDIPSGAASGLKLGNGFTIEPGITLELVVDFDAARSIHIMGNKQGYKLNPVLRLMAKAQSGAIFGKLTNFQDSPVAYAISGADTVATAKVKTDTGNFLLSFLPQGSYTVAVSDTLNRQYSGAGVNVTVGNTNDLGEITLQ
jgi:hypothetical protein